MVAAAHSSSDRGASTPAPVHVPHDYIISGSTFLSDPAYLTEDEEGYADVYRLRDNKTIGPEGVILVTLTFITTREEGRHDGAIQ